jgi:hypothetical protein
MITEALLTQRADTTRAIDFTDHALPCEPAAASNPDKLMPQNSAESHVALTKLQIRFTDPGFRHIDKNFT